ncbi:MAG: GMC oxidoreductase, partial [Flavobacteriaceae bacterium]
LKEAILKPGQWSIGIGGFGEILPHPENRMYLDYDKKDQWGLPTVTFTTKFRENEYKMREEMKSAAIEILEAAGVQNVRGYDNSNSHGIGLGIHEMGTARMGHDPKTSVTNKYNQVHACKNVFMTDGAFMTSANCVNPSLTYMAFSARAANYAADQIEKGLL